MAAVSRFLSPRQAARIFACGYRFASQCRQRVKKLMPHSGKRLAACAVVSVWMSGCGVLGTSKPPAPAVQERPLPDAGAVAPLLEMMSNLPQGDPARQA